MGRGRLSVLFFLPAVADDGAVGVKEADDAAGPVPSPLRATTVTVYEVPFDSPVMEQLRPVVVHAAPPGLAVAV